MKILVVNSGSSSLKCTLFEGKKEVKEVAKARLDGIGKTKCKFSFKGGETNLGLGVKVGSHEEGLKLVFENLRKCGAITKNSEIEKVGHRVVHGGEKYSETVKIDAKVMKGIESLSELAPLHNPINLETIRAAKKILPKATQVAVFDTAFHHCMPEKAYRYALPQELHEEGIRRYGFHGTSHKYVVTQTLKLLKKLPKTKQSKTPRVISCHLGNGSSITASIKGKCVDTSMGLTPLEGIAMGTRCGSIDPAIIFHLARNKKLERIEKILNKESGLKGLSDISNDMRDIWKASNEGNEQAQLTIEILAYQIAKYCGAYSAAMGGLDALVFTGGMGEKAYYVRKKVCQYLEFLGLDLDKKANENNSESISSKKSKIQTYVIQTDEEMQIAKEATKI